jgi:hypothetical protein
LKKGRNYLFVNFKVIFLEYYNLERPLSIQTAEIAGQDTSQIANSTLSNPGCFELFFLIRCYNKQPAREKIGEATCGFTGI